MLAAVARERTEIGTAVTRLLSPVRYALPAGRPLPQTVWESRHRAILILLWLHALAIACFALVAGYGLAHSLVEGAIVGGVATIAAWHKGSRRFRAVMASIGLLISSAILVHLSGGYIEMHFHFFVMVAIITLYQDWVPFLLAIGYVAFHHGVVGTLDPHAVYNHPAAWANPWLWAAIHGGFVMAASIAGIITWRLNEAAHDRAELVLNATSDGLCGLNVHGHIAFANPAAARMLGYEVETLSGQRLHEVLHHAIPSETSYSWETCSTCVALKTGAVEHLTEATFWRTDGTSFPVEYVSTPVRDHSGPVGAVLTFRDITERKQAEEAVRETEVLRRTERLQSALLSSVSHDLRSPLASIKAAVTNLLDEMVDWHAGERRELLSTMNEETDRLTRFVSRLLDLSRIEGHAVEPLRDWHDLEEILSGVVERLDPRVDRVSLQVPGDLPLAYVDYLMVEQISLNLVENALKYSPPTEQVDVTVQVQDGRLTIEIADRGPGIPPGEAARIFEKFYRVSDHAAGASGTGLGLAIARGLARALGGEVHYTPRPGGGSIFTVCLPVEGDERESRAA